MPNPKIRFKKDDKTDFPEWKEVPFWKAVSINSTLVDPTIEPYCNMLHVGAANIEKQTGRLLPCQKAVDEGITSGKYLFDDKCVVYSKIRPELSKATIPGFTGICSADAYPLKPTEGILPKIILEQLLSTKFTNFAVSTSARTKMPKINKEELAHYSFGIPCFEEQEKIVTFVEALDLAINITDEEITNWKSIKDGCLQKLLPSANEVVPEIRFPHFSQTWSRMRLGDLLEEFIQKSSVENEYPVLSSTNSGMEYREGRVSGASNIGYKIIDNNDLVLSPQNLWLGNINVNDMGKGIVSPSYKTFKIKGVNVDFFAMQIRTPYMMNAYKNASVQGASVVRRNLDIKKFRDIEVKVPSVSEQEMIGHFIKDINTIIFIHQQELEHYKSLKKGLLQQMFV